MTIYRLIAPEWLMEEEPTLKRVLEGEFNEEEIKAFNSIGYNIYYLPNYPSIYEGGTVDGFQIDVFGWLFVDMDLKDGTYSSKDEFIEVLGQFPLIPTKIVDSGNGIHVYWRVSDLDAKSYLRLQRRLMRHLKTDEAVGQIYQLMRAPGTINTKHKDAFKTCELLFLEESSIYTSEDFDNILAPITHIDEQHCEQHFNKTYRVNTGDQAVVDEAIPLKFAKLLESNSEVKDIWTNSLEDRSKGDFRLGHVMFASGFTKAEAMSVLVNSAKALSRAPIHRVSYAENIVNKIWTYEITEDKSDLNLSHSVKDILLQVGDNTKGTRFPCWNYIDNTVHGFRLGQVIGLVAGVGVGKTAIALNLFMGFVQNNPNYDHFFVPLEQPANEIADRWKTMCGTNTVLHEKVQVLSNYEPTGEYRNLSLDDIKAYIIKYQKVTGRKVGCVVIDHIGVLKKNSKDGRQSIEDICHKMKGFAMETGTMLVMQSQAPREKAGIGDLELNKDAAYGTVFFEAYCDYLISLWQPVKRCYAEGAPTVTAFKFCKIRHKKQDKDVIKEDVCYKLKFDTETEHLRPLTQDEETSFTFFLNKATNKRKQDKKTDLVEYTSVRWSDNGKTDNNKNVTAAS